MFNSDCRFIVRTKETKKLFDRLCINNLYNKKHNIKAKYGPDYLEHKAKKINKKFLYNLQDNICLKRGSLVMLTNNLNTGIGLCNGSLGKV